MDKKILALFDFCETLPNFQTLDSYLPMAGALNPNYTEEKNMKRRKEYQEKGMIYPRYEHLIDFPISEAKKLARHFIYEEVLPKLNRNILQKLFYHQDNGHTIVIVSGGLEIYIKEFAKIYNIEHVVAVALETIDEKLTGNIDGIHTMQERKLYKLDQMLDLKKYDLKNSYAYSDCVSDIPLLSLVGNANVVECGKDLQWAKILGYQILTQ
ncbi:HAD-IB family hydrolase [Campylobacter sp. MIT 12-8780]|uniref:HAD-IB family hydrolase n=1 Tax=unclassified Campylobacter TaxID=2593542 RepID=UPI00115E51B8|nr:MULTISPECIES: HAD-IB family hydrolase [unclassified Campylobacter]NDJ26628.1 HAD-IB family hydrolase [Campylobacter sp. MIT 19-121]TQR43188.1 HAD-IB family hydrolase [Campylobacter sp. MIT 12-8780]